MFAGNELDLLADHLNNMEEIRPVIYTQKSYEDLIGLWWVIGLILFLLSLEWFLRKRSGGY